MGMLIPRLHFEEKGIIAGRSKCMHCGDTLRPHNLIPLISYLIQKGKSACCSKKIIAWYPLIELTTALAFGGLALYTNELSIWAIAAFHFLVLIFVFFYDLRFKEIHDAILIPAIGLSLLFAWLSGDFFTALQGAAIGFAFYAIQYYPSRGQWVGAGDMRIGAFIGSMLGAKLFVPAIAIAYGLGSLIAIYLLFIKKVGRKASIALGPFLSTGAILSYFFGEVFFEQLMNLWI